MLLRTAILSLLVVSIFSSEAADVQPPKPAREFRAAWVASVGNIQWPSRRDLTVEQQKAELIAILNRAQDLNMNAIVLQVRPACDALYASKLEPWSEYLTGTMGKAPQPFYDPLTFAITEAHKRAIELHAWINPYRARVVASKSPVSTGHVSKKYPGMIIPYGKYLWLDPSQKAVQDYTLAIVTDIVKRYDIDGLHMDDYFYPYAEKDKAGKTLPFNDDVSWRKYQASGGKLSRGDWRRDAVNTLVARSYKAIKAEKPLVKFGVAPFGIWKPGYPATTSLKSGNMYEQIYCDSLKWWTNGWVDYFSPQLYWPINPPDQSFTALLRWWSERNVKRRHLWPGMNTTKVGATNWPAEEILNQIKVARATPTAHGHVHWSMKGVMRGSGALSEGLKDIYAEPALVPASPWLSSVVPGKPVISVKKQNGKLLINTTVPKENPTLWVFQKLDKNGWKTEIISGKQSTFSAAGSVNAIALSSVSRSGIQSKPTVIDLRK